MKLHSLDLDHNLLADRRDGSPDVETVGGMLSVAAAHQWLETVYRDQVQPALDEWIGVNLANGKLNDIYKRYNGLGLPV